MKLLNKLFSIIIFFICFIIMYESLYFIYINKIDRYLDNIKLSDKLNLETSKPNYFIDNVNDTYKDLTNLNYSYEDIIKFENDSNINSVVSNILKNKINYLIDDKELVFVYSKKNLDKELTANIKNKEIKDYIISNNYKIIQFESRLNSRIKKINDKLFKIISLLLDVRVFISLCSLLLICILIYLIIKKHLSVFTPILAFSIFNILINIIEIVLLKIYNYNIISYFFDSFILDIIKTSVIISVVVICINLLFITIFNKKDKIPLKPRIRKVKRNEEDFSFGL